MAIRGALSHTNTPPTSRPTARSTLAASCRPFMTASRAVGRAVHSCWPSFSCHPPQNIVCVDAPDDEDADADEDADEDDEDEDELARDDEDLLLRPANT